MKGLEKEGVATQVHWKALREVTYAEAQGMRIGRRQLAFKLLKDEEFKKACKAFDKDGMAKAIEYVKRVVDARQKRATPGAVQRLREHVARYAAAQQAISQVVRVLKQNHLVFPYAGENVGRVEEYADPLKFFEGQTLHLAPWLNGRKMLAILEEKLHHANS